MWEVAHENGNRAPRFSKKSGHCARAEAQLGPGRIDGGRAAIAGATVDAPKNTARRGCADGARLLCRAFGPVAQLVEHRTENAGVASSILAWATTPPLA
jgi:hypothetical protein